MKLHFSTAANHIFQLPWLFIPAIDLTHSVTWSSKGAEPNLFNLKILKPSAFRVTEVVVHSSISSFFF